MDKLRKIWRFIPYNWVFGLSLILLIGTTRFILVLDANASSGGYGVVSIIFVVMWFLPFIFLSRYGQKEIGIRKPSNYKWLVFSLVLGFIYCCLMFIIAKVFFGDSINNSFVYISQSYIVPHDLLVSNKLMIFIPFAISGMIFSPIGEEFFYRGLVHSAFVEQFGERKASLIDSLAFALTHLAHFGIIFDMGQWKFPVFPAFMWVLGMFLLSQLLFFCKQKSGSIWGAVVGHAGYNLAMIYLIFYYIF